MSQGLRSYRRRGEGIRGELPLVYPIVSGPWHELAERASWCRAPNGRYNGCWRPRECIVTLVAFASVEELEEGLGVMEASAAI